MAKRRHTPEQVINKLREAEVAKADGSEVTFDVYDVAVLWDDQPKYVLADAADTTPLVGMRMLDRHNLNIDVADGGRVVIQAKE